MRLYRLPNLKGIMIFGQFHGWLAMRDRRDFRCVRVGPLRFVRDDRSGWRLV